MRNSTHKLLDEIITAVILLGLAGIAGAAFALLCAHMFN